MPKYVNTCNTIAMTYFDLRLNNNHVSENYKAVKYIQL